MYGVADCGKPTTREDTWELQTWSLFVLVVLCIGIMGISTNMSRSSKAIGSLIIGLCYFIHHLKHDLGIMLSRNKYSKEQCLFLYNFFKIILCGCKRIWKYMTGAAVEESIRGGINWRQLINFFAWDYQQLKKFIRHYPENIVLILSDNGKFNLDQR